MGKLAFRGLVLVVVIGVLGVGSYAIAGGGSKHFNGEPADRLSRRTRTSRRVATGSFKARLSNDGTSIHYELSYSGLEGTVHAGARPLRKAGGQRRHLVLPVRHQPRPERPRRTNSGYAGRPRRSRGTIIGG